MHFLVCGSTLMVDGEYVHVEKSFSCGKEMAAAEKGEKNKQTQYTIKIACYCSLSARNIIQAKDFSTSNM